MERTSDHELIERFVSGEVQAFEEIVRRHWKDVIGLASRWLGSAGADSAEDVAVEVFEVLHRHLPEWRGEAELRTWLYRATFNKCGNVIQAQRRRRRASERLSGIRNGDSAAPPEREVQVREQSRRLRRALESLPARERSVVILFHYRSLSPAKIAKVLGLSLSTVKRALRKSLDRLKHILLSD